MRLVRLFYGASIISAILFMALAVLLPGSARFRRVMRASSSQRYESRPA